MQFKVHAQSSGSKNKIQMQGLENIFLEINLEKQYVVIKLEYYKIISTR